MAPTPTFKTIERKIYLMLKSNIKFILNQERLIFKTEERPNTFSIETASGRLSLSCHYLDKPSEPHSIPKELF